MIIFNKINTTYDPNEESKDVDDKENKPLIVDNKENRPVEQDQALSRDESDDEEGNLNISDEADGIIQKVYSCVEMPCEFHLNYTDLKTAFVERVKTKNPNALTKNIETEINNLAAQIAQCNYDLLMLIGTAPFEIREYFREEKY